MSYEFEYDGPSARPRWVKVILDSEGVEQRVVLNFTNEEERKFLNDDDVYAHLDNLVQYIKDISQTISPIGLDERPTDGWHFNGGWGEVEWAKDETFRWWESVYFKNESDEEEPA
jgi:hypothetical protein